MENTTKVIYPEDIHGIIISNQLRIKLELELKKLFEQNKFIKYNDKKPFGLDLNNDHHLHNYLLGPIPDSLTIKGKLISGIKNWLNMRDKDRLIIIVRFKDLYCSSLPVNATVPVHILNRIFCKFLINELLQILSDFRWQLTVHKIRCN